MGFIFSTAAKNILRNKRRTVLSGLAIFIVAVVICLLLSVEYAAIDDMRTNIINHLTGNVRVRNKQFTLHERVMPLQFYVPESRELAAIVSEIPGVRAVNLQINVPVSIYRNNKVDGARAVGTDFAVSPFFSDRNTKFISGGLPSLENPGRSAVISQGLAQKTGLSVGDRFTFMTKTASGGSNGVTATVTGVAHIGDTDFNGESFFMDIGVLSQYMRMGGNAPELLVFTDPKVSSRQIETKIIPAIYQKAETLGFAAEIEAVEWIYTSSIFAFIQMADISYAFMTVFFFLLAATVIFNTTMMSVLERKKEIGTLMSLGLEQGKISAMFLLETGITAFCSTLAGLLLGFVLVSLMGKYGLDMNMFGENAISGFGFSAWIYPALHWSKYLLILFLGTFVSVTACIFPVRMVRKIQPAEALRTEN